MLFAREKFEKKKHVLNTRLSNASDWIKAKVYLEKREKIFKFIVNEFAGSSDYGLYVHFPSRYTVVCVYETV